MQLLKYGICTVLSSVNCTCMCNYSGSTDRVNSYGEWRDLPNEAGISSYCKTWLFHRAHALEFMQAKAGLSLWKPAEPSWDPVQKISKTQHQKSELPQMSSQNYVQLFHFLPSGSCSCVHIKRILFQGHIWVSLERNESERTKSQWALQAEEKLTRRGNYQWKRWGITAPKGTSINLKRVVEQSLSCWTGIKEPLAQKWWSPNPMSAPPEPTRKEPSHYSPGVHFSIIFQCNLQTHWNKWNTFWRKPNTFLINILSVHIV